jgi:large subunit ribosomal protein L10
MAKTRAQKEEIVAKVEGALKGAASSVFVHFKGVTVAQESKMRRAFRTEGLGYTVAKKTLIRIALDNLGYDHQNVPMDGEVAVAYNTTSDDPTLAANRIFAYGKELGADKVTILGGIFEGKFVDASAMTEIATIPSMLVLRGKLLNLISSPLQRLTMVIDQNAQKHAQAGEAVQS